MNPFKAATKVSYKQPHPSTDLSGPSNRVPAHTATCWWQLGVNQFCRKKKTGELVNSFFLASPTPQESEPKEGPPPYLVTLHI